MRQIKHISYEDNVNISVFFWQWMSILDKVYQVMVSCDLGKIDSVMVGEIALRLALLYEATSMQQMNASKHADTGL